MGRTADAGSMDEATRGTIEGDQSPLVTNFNKMWRLSQANHLPRLAQLALCQLALTDLWCCSTVLADVIIGVVANAPACFDASFRVNFFFRLGYRSIRPNFVEFLKCGTLWHPEHPRTYFFRRVVSDQYECVCGCGCQVIRREKCCLRFIRACELGGGTCKVSGCSNRRRLRLIPNHFVVGTNLAYCDRSADDLDGPWHVMHKLRFWTQSCLVYCHVRFIAPLKIFQ